MTRADLFSSRIPPARGGSSQRSLTLACAFGVRNISPAPSAADGNGRGVAPQALQRVIGPGVLEEDVGQHIAVVEEDPAALRGALRVQRPDAPGLEVAQDAFGDRAHMGNRAPAADEEEIGHARERVDVEHHQVTGLLVQGGARGSPRRLLGRTPAHAEMSRYSRRSAMYAMTSGGRR